MAYMNIRLDTSWFTFSQSVPADRPYCRTGRTATSDVIIINMRYCCTFNLGQTYLGPAGGTRRSAILLKKIPNHRLCTKCITTAEEEQSTAQHKVHVGTQYRTFFVAPFSFLLTRPAEAHEPGIPSQSLRSRLCTICPTNVYMHRGLGRWQ